MDCSGAVHTPPVYEYGHADAGCSSITGGAFVPDGASWPASYDDSYLFGDYVCGKLFELRPDAAGGFAPTEFVTGLEGGGPVDLAFDPFDGNPGLHYTTYANGGEVRRVTYAGGAGNRAPNAVVNADPTSGPAPLSVAFDGSRSSDPDGDALSYHWDFGDGSPSQTTNAPTIRHTYSERGAHTATLTVRDTSGAEDAATVSIDAGGGLPQPEIELPAEDQTFAVGQKIVLRGSATDPEDGSLAGGNAELASASAPQRQPHAPLPPPHCRQQRRDHRPRPGGPLRHKF